MKDKQGCHIVNEETINIIRNLRQKAIHEKRPREYYVNLILESWTPMRIIEEHAQEWCIEHGIIGYDYITRTRLNVRKK